MKPLTVRLRDRGDELSREAASAIDLFADQLLDTERELEETTRELAAVTDDLRAAGQRPPHRVTVLQWSEQFNRLWALAMCDCGWIGPERAHPVHAARDYRDHIEEQ